MADSPPAYPYPPTFPQPQPSSGIEFVRDADFLIQSFLPPSELAVLPHAQTGIPCRSALPKSPFPSIRQQLLAFIDGLNLAMTASPPLRVVNFAGKVIGFIPYHWAMIAGAVMQTAAQTGMHVLSKTLTDRYLRAANLRLFKPRASSSASARRPRCSTSSCAPAPAPVPRPGQDRPRRRDAAEGPREHQRRGDGQKMPLATQRRLASLEGYALPLHLDVPPPAKAQGVMDTMASWGVAFDEWRTGRKQNKIEQRRRELERVEQQLQRLGVNPHGGAPQPGYGGAGPSQGMSYGETYVMGRRERKDLRRAARRARKRERAGTYRQLDRAKESRLERRVANSDLLEHWASESGLWVVIMNVELDREIEGIERAESMDNEEHVDAKTWQAEIIKERDALEEEEDSDSDDEGGAGHFGSDHKSK
ncbi:hypothetical protein B0H13DRAFT_2330630 [Mycena leptocephala]|nr:hypothetical protein B0H13DRAFT_2330630 [Mycena leptocephala]